MWVETDEREGAERFKLDVWMDNYCVRLSFRSWETTHLLADRMLQNQEQREMCLATVVL